jgi:Flp pilus assembly pilin Flp
MLPTFQPLLIQLKNRLLSQDGQDLVEYALIVGMLSVCAVATEQNVAISIAAAWMNVATSFNAAV